MQLFKPYFKRKIINNKFNFLSSFQSSMKRKLEAFGVGDDTAEVDKLQDEVTQLREQLKRPPTPTRFTIAGVTNAQVRRYFEYHHLCDGLKI